MSTNYKLLLINATSNWGSTGRITEQLGAMALKRGWDCHVIYGRSHNPSELKTHCFSSRWSVYEHYIENRLFDNDGLASRIATKNIVEFIKKLNPDVIHLHNIHDHWINYEILFKYLKTTSIPIIWTLHDCWSFTGGCAHFSYNRCDKWKKGCRDCSLKRGILPFMKQSETHFFKKSKLFLGINRITLVPVSKWLESLVKDSFLGSKDIRLIYNGVDTKVFQPVNSCIKEKYGIGKNALLVGVATSWYKRKGLDDYMELAKQLPSDITIMLVGLSTSQIQALPKGVIGIQKTQNVSELVDIYSGADIVLNLSYEESFGLTTVEGFACGTPGIVYNATASPELVTPDTGAIVEAGDIRGLKEAIVMVLKKGKKFYSDTCRKRALLNFDKIDRFEEYMKLYQELCEN